MPYLKKMPSGNWKCQYRVDGKYRCVTAPTKKEAELRALEDQLATKRERDRGHTVASAVRAYIDSRDEILSPSTIQGYEKDLTNHILPHRIANVLLRDLSDADYQAFVNDVTGTVGRRGQLSPKTVKNICKLVEASVRFDDPSRILRAKLPAPRKQIVHLLALEDVIAITKGTEIELPVLLAAWLSLSMSEIRGLTPASVQGTRLIVRGSVIDVNNEAVHRLNNKAFERTRSIDLPPEILALIKQTDAWRAGTGFLVPMTSNGIYKRWQRIQRDAGVPDDQHMTFHGLRHLCASEMEDLHIPISAAMQRGGWATKDTLTRVYQHAITSKQSIYDRRINDRYSAIYNAVPSVDKKVDN